MKLEKLNNTCYYFTGRVTIGYVKQGNSGLLIDAGIDQATMKKVLKQLKKENLPITHLFITHAHSDHFGGAHYLQAQFKVTTIAPFLEEAIMRNPILEPLYLFGGNDPLPELRNKFLEGKPISIDRVINEGEHTIDDFTFDTLYLPGHSYYQLAIRINDILYAGDSYFGLEELAKHKILFLTDAQLAIESLQELKSISCQGAVPGHGIFEEDFQRTIDSNIAYHEELLKWLELFIQNSTKATHETIVAEMCAAYKVEPTQLSQWLLFRTAVTSYLLALIKREKISHSIEQGRWVFQHK